MPFMTVGANNGTISKYQPADKQFPAIHRRGIELESYHVGMIPRSSEYYSDFVVKGGIAIFTVTSYQTFLT